MGAVGRGTRSRSTRTRGVHGARSSESLSRVRRYGRRTGWKSWQAAGASWATRRLHVGQGTRLRSRGSGARSSARRSPMVEAAARRTRNERCETCEAMGRCGIRSGRPGSPMERHPRCRLGQGTGAPSDRHRMSPTVESSVDAEDSAVRLSSGVTGSDSWPARMDERRRGTASNSR